MNKKYINDKIVILGHENPDVDSIVSGMILNKIMTLKGYNSEYIIPDKTIQKDTLSILKRYNIDPSIYQKELPLENDTKYILVDHNERIVNGEIIAIIDHHKTNKEKNIEYYYNNEISSTACFICIGQEELLSKHDIILSVVATLVDTVSFHSTKGRKIDEDWCKQICEKYNINYEELYKEGLCITDISNHNECAFNGLKKYTIKDKRVRSSYIQIEYPDNIKQEIEEIINIIKEHIQKENIDYFVFIVHDMINFKTMYYLISKDEITTNYYNFYAQRGNTIMIDVENYINNLK